MDTIAKKTVSAIDADGSPFDMTIAIGCPQEQLGLDWTCSLSITRLYNEGHVLVGIDSWQALQMALYIAQTTIAAFIERGGRLFWLGTEEPLAVEDLFAGGP